VAEGKRILGSFRDPSGHLFTRDGVLYRQINEVYRPHYDHLMGGGLYERLVEMGALVEHSQEHARLADSDGAYRVIRPVPVPFVSYPYEWCFSQLRDAALLTLDIQKTALEFGMSLKDASAYNVQFVDSSPVLIDTLSFEMYREGEPWVAYKQFCQHFLAPLALMAHEDVRLAHLLRVHIDGIPLDLASRLLPVRTRLSLGLLTHIFIHARAQKRYAGQAAKPSGKMPRASLVGLIGGLRSTVSRLRWHPPATEWGDYYRDTNYSDDAMGHKAETVAQYVEKVGPGSAWDLGANTGEFSRLAADAGAMTVAFDVDPVAVERHYRHCRKQQLRNLLPLVLDLTNPSPAIGWDNAERMALGQRGQPDLAMALALIHHLAISNNLPFARIAGFLASIAPNLIIEFVPKKDSQVQKLLTTREDIFADYDQSSFERAFENHFHMEESTAIRESERVLYRMRRKA
jgi:ribosomal protein L11 methylase PrmA